MTKTKINDNNNAINIETINYNSTKDIIEQELESLRIIFPELVINDDLSACQILIEIKLIKPIKLKLKDNTLNSIIKYLPDIKLSINLPINYPYFEPPIVDLLNVENWLPHSKKSEILNNLFEIWNNFKDSILFNYIDYIKSNSEDGFGLFQNIYNIEKEEKEVINDNNNDLLLVIDNIDSFNRIIKVNELKEENEFNKSTFNCEICQLSHKGLNIIQFPNCNDTFCIKCLNNYFTHIINYGEIENIHCPSFNCTKLFQNEKLKLVKKIENNLITDFASFNKTFFKPPIENSILTKIFSNNELIEKYEYLFKKFKLQQYQIYFPNRVAECPRDFCSTIIIKSNPDNKLAICNNCKFAFCSDCLHSWHGNINPCSNFIKNLPIDTILKFIKHNGNKDLKFQSIEDKRIISNINFKYGKKIVELSVNDYISQLQFDELIKSGSANIVKCPNCLTLIQKSDGCNKMTCSKCNIFFCNLCGDRLNRNDPYEHYNNPMNPCFSKLFQGMIVDDEEL